VVHCGKHSDREAKTGQPVFLVSAGGTVVRLRGFLAGSIGFVGFWSTVAAPALAAQPFEGVTINHFVSGGASDLLAGYREMAKEFHEQTGATVEFIPAPWQEMQTQMVNDFLSKAGNFDVLDIDIAWDPTISPYLVRLDEEIAKSGYDIADYKGLNALIGVDPKTHARYGIPSTGRSMVMFYRKDLYENAGLKPPTTWDELIADTKALTAKSTYGFVAAGVNVQLNKYFYSAYKDDQQRPLFSADGQPQFVNEYGVRALERLKTIFGFAPPGVFAMDIPEVDQVFLNGDAATIFEWPDYIIPSLDDPDKSRVAGKWGAMRPPGPGNYAPWYVGISEFSHHKDAAWAWVNFLTSFPQNKQMMLNYGSYSTRSSVLADPDIKKKFPAIDAVADAAAHSFTPTFLAHPKGIDWFVQAGAFWSAAASGQSDPETELKKAAALWNQMRAATNWGEGFDYSERSAQ
jgi:multiple sugar transport system substrate-binding protein